MAQLDHQGHCLGWPVDWTGLVRVLVYVLNYTTHSMSAENIHLLKCLDISNIYFFLI